jgi:hypothetical protein
LIIDIVDAGDGELRQNKHQQNKKAKADAKARTDSEANDFHMNVSPNDVTAAPICNG